MELGGSYSVSHPMEGFDVSGAELYGSATRVSVIIVSKSKEPMIICDFSTPESKQSRDCGWQTLLSRV